MEAHNEKCLKHLQKEVSELKARNKALLDENEKLRVSNGVKIHPINMVMEREEYNLIKNSAFCWRWYRRDGVDFRLLTIEGENYSGPLFPSE